MNSLAGRAALVTGSSRGLSMMHAFHHSHGAAQVTHKRKQAEAWLAPQRTLWERRLDQFDAHVGKLKEKG